MSLKVASQWSIKRCQRKLDMTLGPLTEYVRWHQRRTCLIAARSCFPQLPRSRSLRECHGMRIGVASEIHCFSSHLSSGLSRCSKRAGCSSRGDISRAYAEAEWSHLKGTRRANPDAKK